MATTPKSLAAHDKRFHGGHYEGGACKYREKRGIPTAPANGDSDSANAPSAAEQYLEAVEKDKKGKSVKESIAFLHSFFDEIWDYNTAIEQTTVKDQYERYSENGRRLVRINDILKKSMKGMSAKEHEQSLIEFADCIRKLKDEHPNMNLHIPMLCIAHWKRASTGGYCETEEHKQTKELFPRFLQVGVARKKTIDLMRDSSFAHPYGHADSRLTQDFMRHEIGHALQTKSVVDKFKEKAKEEFGDYSGQGKFSELLGEKVSPYAKGNEWNAKEAIAECFSMITDEGYKKGTLPSFIEDIVFNDMLHDSGN